MTTKYMAGRLPFPESPYLLIPGTRERARIRELSFTERDALQVAKLPPIHKDPFDRMLICQALPNEMVIVTPDPEIRKYPVETLW